jgi:hypothetical protein
LLEGIFKELFFHLRLLFVWLLIGLIESDLELFLLACFWLRRALSYVAVNYNSWRVYKSKLIRLLNLIDNFIKRGGSNGVPLSYFCRYRLYFERINDFTLGL